MPLNTACFNTACSYYHCQQQQWQRGARRAPLGAPGAALRAAARRACSRAPPHGIRYSSFWSILMYGRGRLDDDDADYDDDDDLAVDAWMIDMDNPG